MKYKKTIMLAMLLISLLSISAVSASENVAADTIGTDNTSNDINLEDEDYDDYEDYDEDSDWNDEHYSDNFQPRIIPEDYSYRQNIPEQINYSTDYDENLDEGVCESCGVYGQLEERDGQFLCSECIDDDSDD